jgi:hypothetical protein
MQNRLLLFIVCTIALIFSTAETLAQPQRKQLTPEQQTERLKDTLALDDEQTTKVLAIYEEMDGQRSVIFETNAGDRRSMMEEMRKLTQEADAKIEALLTQEQSEKFQMMRKRIEERRREFRRRNE